MRAIIVLLGLLFVGAAFAAKDDVACVVHSDDCGKCLSNGCNWCADGYCVSKESDICEADKVATSCPLKQISKSASADRTSRRFVPGICESATNCSQCANAAGCFVCVDPATRLTKCSTNPDCISPDYNLQYEWWIPLIGFDFSFAAGTCPGEFPPAFNSPILRLIIAIFIFGDAIPDLADIPESLVKGKVLFWLRNILPPELFDARQVLLFAASFDLKKRDSTQNAEILVKFADRGDITGQAIAATLLDEAPTVFSLDSNSPNVLVDPLLPTTGTSGAAVQGRGSSNSDDDLELSKGALAGIIIGSIIGGALLIALIAWLIFRRRDAYPQAFRSPAAAYRP
jgi:hypothetical protein